jgi:ornithine carbamoyltransferase
VKAKNLLSITDLSAAEITGLIEKAVKLKKKPRSSILAGKVLALIFEKPSLRTRVSFELAMQQLGGQGLYLSSAEVGLGKREPVSDVTRVLSRFVNGIAARTFSHETLVEMTRYASIPIVNALDDMEHPCQALADILTIYEHKKRLKGLTLAYIGDANNVANSLVLAAAAVGINCVLASPEGYQMQEYFLRKAGGYGKKSGSTVIQVEKPAEAVKTADIIYTDVWTSMGQEEESEKRRRDFTGYQINKKLIAKGKKDAILMHPLPAHYGEEAAPGIYDLPASVVFDQAENRLHAQKAVLAELMKK